MGEKVFLYIFSFVGISCYFPLLVTLVMKQRKHKRCWLSDPTKEKKEIKLRQNTPKIKDREERNWGPFLESPDN